MFIYLLAAASLTAGALDSEMSREEKKKTGVYKLTQKEQGALQQWIDNYYTKREAPLEAAPEIRSLLQENLMNGTYIRLSNGSLWNIDPQDTPISQSWITPVDIIVANTEQGDYPYKLTNSLTGSFVRAKKATRLPSK